MRSDRLSLLTLEKHPLAAGKSLSHTWEKKPKQLTLFGTIVIISGNLMPPEMR